MVAFPLLLTFLAHATPTLLIRGGTIYDGSGKPPYVADIRIKGDRIDEIGKLEIQPDDKIIEAAGLAVSPGFIDAHSHADGEILVKPAALTAIRQGITTAIVGQDGGSSYPLSDFAARLKSTPPAINLASFVGHGTLRRKVMGDDYKRAAKPEEVAKMATMMETEMKSGGLGLSSGLEYDPGFYGTTDEVADVAKVAAKFGGIYISHVRDEENEVFKSFEELISVARKAHLPAQVSHIKLGSSPVWHKANEALALFESARKEKLDISEDVYPYLYWQSTITVITPTRDWGNRKAWEQGLEEIGGPEHVLLTSFSPDRSWEGKTIEEISKSVGKDAVTVIQDIVARTHGEKGTGSESVVVTAMTEEDLTTFIRDPHIMFCTDGGLTPSHPRGAGSFPRILGLYVREKGVLTLQAAIHKMTSLPADRFHLVDRGRLGAHRFADLVIFDPNGVIDTATTKDPQAPPKGIKYVIVNGQISINPEGATSAHAGLFLKRGG